MVAIWRWCLLLRLALVTVGSAFGISLLPKLVNDTGNGHRLPGAMAEPVGEDSVGTIPFGRSHPQLPTLQEQEHVPLIHTWDKISPSFIVFPREFRSLAMQTQPNKYINECSSDETGDRSSYTYAMGDESKPMGQGCRWPDLHRDCSCISISKSRLYSENIFGIFCYHC